MKWQTREGAPDWVKGVSVEDGAIVLDVKPIGNSAYCTMKGEFCTDNANCAPSLGRVSFWYNIRNKRR